MLISNIEHRAHALVVEWLAALVDVAAALELGTDRPVGHALLVEPPGQVDGLGPLLSAAMISLVIPSPPCFLVYPTVVVGHGPGRRRSPGTFNRRIREHSEGSPFGVDDAHLEAFDWMLQDLDVHCQQHK